MTDSITIGRRLRRIVSAAVVTSVVALACTTVFANGATPIISIGPTTSPTGGTATGTVASDGQTDACLDQQHSGVSPSTTSAPGVLQLGDRACTTSNGAGTPTTAAAPSAGGADGGGGSGTGAAAGGTQSSTQTATNSRSSTSVTRRAAGATSTSSSTQASVSAAGARGLRIALIRSKLIKAKAGNRLRIVVTLRDRQRRLVRSAIVSVGRLPGARTTLPRLHVRYSNQKGQAAFVVPVTKTMLGRRVLFRVRAHTPSAHVLNSGGVLVPGKRSHHQATRFVASG
jgi:hypothetical protein